MAKKIFKSIFITVTAILICAFAVISGFGYRNYSSDIHASLTGECMHMKSGIDRWGVDFLGTVSKDGTRVTFFDENGMALFDSRLEPSRLSEIPSHMGTEELSEALSAGIGISERESLVFSGRWIFVAMRTEDGCFVTLSVPESEVWSFASDILIPLAVLFAAAAVAAFFVSRYVSKKIVEPINEIDLDDPDGSKIYPELLPMTDRIRLQNYSLSRRLSELRMKENEFNLLTNNMNEGMVLINSRGTVLSINRSARKIFGMNEPLPAGIFSICGSEGFRNAVSTALLGRTSYHSIETGDKFYHITVTPIFHDGGRADGAVIVALDETEKEAREALRREFTSNVSHELKTPLTSISGFAELIKSGMAEGEDAKRFASNIHKEATRLVSLVGDIIRLAQLDGGEIPYDGEVDLMSSASAVIERLSHIAELSEVTLSLEGEHASVDGNITILEEMMFNLVDNAIKYNRKGGNVTVRVSGGEQPELSVSDTGIGIPETQQDRVFERFYRVDKSHSRAIGGTGLGLSIVKHAAAYHNAKISLESVEGVGTTVTVSFLGK